MFALKDKLVVSSPTYSKMDFTQAQAVVETAAQEGFGTFMLSRTRYTFDIGALKDALDDFADSASGPVEVTVGDLRKIDFFKKAKKEEIDDAMIPSIHAIVDTSEILAINWPAENISPGATAVIGGRGAGKTEFLRRHLKTDILIRLNEPMEHVDLEDAVYPASSVTNAISVAILLSLGGLRVAIDSFKSLVYGLEGAAMSGGMSSGVFDFMTTFNNLTANFGVHIVVTVNPMDPDKVARTFDLLAASLTGAIHIDSRVVRADTYRLRDGRVVNINSAMNLAAEDEVSVAIQGPDFKLNLPETVTPVASLEIEKFQEDIEDNNDRIGGRLSL